MQKAELRALVHGVCEGLWLERMFKELNMTYEGSMKFLCKSLAIIGIVKNPMCHDRTKHVDIDRHFVKEKLDSKLINYAPMRLQIADILMKSIAEPRFENLTGKL